MKIGLAKLREHPAAPSAISVLFMATFIFLAKFAGNLPSMLGIQSKPLSGIIGCLAAVVTLLIYKPRGKQGLQALGMIWEAKTPLRFIYGLLIGTILFMLMIAALLAFTPLTLKHSFTQFSLQSLTMYAMLIPLALMEEIAFRSYPQLTLNKAYGVWVSQFVVAFCFGACHIVYGWSAAAAFCGPFIWGFVFGLAAIWSGGIAMPLGIHLVLNVLQNLFGMKGSDASIWKLDFMPGTTKALMQQTETVGLILQAAVLIGALLATAWYQHRAKQT